MQKVYENRDFPMVGHFQSILESMGIRTEVRNEAGNSLAGEVPFTQTYPELWVFSDQDAATANAVIRDYQKQEQLASPAKPWTCPKCEADVDAEFAACWSCGSAIPETEGP